MKTNPTLVWIAVLVGGAIAAFFVIAIVLRLFRGKPRRTFEPAADLKIDLNQLDATGPLPTGPQLEFYGTPVRLAALVVAPTGRAGTMPPLNRMGAVVELLVPGLSQVLEAHQPIVRRWPGQLSSQGFVQSFQLNVQLPGSSGKGTPWCSAAGKFDFGEGHLLAGLICCAAVPNALGQVMVEFPGKWNDVLRVVKPQA